MSYITRNANMILLFLIVLIAASLVGATVFFQARFTNVNQEYDIKLAELENVTAQVEEYRGVLEKAQIELELKASREEQFTEKYTEAKATADELERESQSLEVQLADAYTSIDSKIQQISALSSQVVSLESDIAAKQSANDDLEDDIEDLEDKVDCLETTDDPQEGTAC